MTETSRLSLPLLAAGQAQKHVTHNDALIRLDALVHLVVESRSQTVAPAAPTGTAAYIVPPSGAAGAFSGHDDELAIHEDDGWTFLAPRPGWQAWVIDEAEHHVWTGAEWRRSSPVSSLGASVWGVNTTADATARLAVSSEASLFNHAGTDHRLAISKQAAARTASMIFQTDFSGRAELGLAGDDDFRIKVSADGAAWTDALAVNRTTGSVALPATSWARDQPQPNLLVNGDWQINQRSFAGGALASGSYGFDRWKAHTGGANLSRSGFDLTLTSGSIQQIVEPSLWGLPSFAQIPLCLSVEALNGGSLSVSAGGATGTITAGSGRRSVVLTPGPGDTGALTVQLAPASGAVTLRRIKLETGSVATPWPQRSVAEERQLCERYHWRPNTGMLIDTYQGASGYFTQFLPFPTTMRATPTTSFTVSQDFNVLNGERTIGAYSASMGYAQVRANAQGRVFAVFADIAFNAEL